VYRLLRRELGDISPRAYVITLSEEAPPQVAAGATIIRTNGTHFLHQVKDRLVDVGHMLPDESSL
jgi:hypothetical protein